MGPNIVFRPWEAKEKLAIRSEQAKRAWQFSGVTVLRSGAQRDNARL
jgi:hypothetical protein